MISAESLFQNAQGPSTLDEPLAHLMACHRRIEQRLATLERAAAHLSIDRVAALQAFANSFAFLDTNGVLHTADEEESLFPRLMPLLEPGERAFIAGLEHDHNEAHRLYTELKQTLTGARPDAAHVRGVVERLRALYRRHIAAEDEQLQAYAQQLLSAEAVAAIAQEMKQRRGLKSSGVQGEGGGR